MLRKKVKSLLNYFTKTEISLWCISVMLILVSFIIFDRESILTLIASLIGVTSLIFNAKGNPFGQFLMVVFSVLYGIISFTFSYYGEMITYLGMTAPMAVFALISWIRNPYNEPIKEERNSFDDFADCCYYLYFLLYIVSFSHSQFNTKYNIRYNKFSCRIFDIQKKRFLCCRLCRK